MEDPFHFFPLWKRGMKEDFRAFQKAKLSRSREKEILQIILL
jgi:hypothetical protein